MSTLPLETRPAREIPRSDGAAPVGLGAPGWLGRLSRLPAWAGVAAVLAFGGFVHFPALRSQFMLDDFLHASMLEGTFPVERHPLDLYNFVDDGDRAALFDRGLLPWWSHPQLTIRFFRPLSSALLWADYALFGEDALARHLHSYVWWALVVIAAFALFRRAFSPRVAWIATFAYAVAPCHAMPIAWIANREALVSLAFGTAGLLSYVKWREARGARDAALATLLFSCALLAGEYGISFGGYVLAYELVRRGDPIARRGVALLPFAAPAAAYLAVRSYLGYGSIGSGYYLDPLHVPAVFLWLAPRRLATLLAEAWLSLDQDTLTWSIPSWALLLGTVALGALIVGTLRRSTAAIDEAQRRTASWLALGSCFALAPVLAVVPGPRLIGASVLGISACVALVLDATWFPAATPGAPEPSARARRARELTALVALALGFAQLVHGPATAWLMGRHFRRTSGEFARQVESLRAQVPDPAHTDVLVVRGLAGAFFAPFAIDPSGSLPMRFRVLAQTGHVLALRPGPRTIELIGSHDHGLIPAGEANLFTAGRALYEGDVFEVPGMRVTILEMENDLPRIARFELEGEVDAPGVVWLNETEKAYFPGTPPNEGFGRPYDFDH